MYKDKEKQREAARLAMRKLRAKGITEGITMDEGITETPNREGITSEEGITYPDIIYKLVDPKWRENIAYMCTHLRPGDKECTYLGGVPMDTVCNWLDCVQDVPCAESPKDSTHTSTQPGTVYSYSSDWKQPVPV